MSIIPNYVPRPMKTVNVVLTVKNALKAVEFYNRAFAAEEVMRLTDPNTGHIVHSEIRITDTIILINEEEPGFTGSPESLGGTGVTIQLYVPDVEGFWEEALKAGAEIVHPIRKQFYGDRAGRLRDPFGHQWIVATHMEDLTAAEIHSRFNQLYS